MTVLTVTIVFALPERTVEMEMRLRAGATIADALARFPPNEIANMDLASAPVGVWGRRVERNHVLADGDRVEIYRPLVADAKTARRRRVRRENR